MKKYSSIAALLFSVAGLLVPARAQEAKLIVTVPFEFIVGTQTLPPGTYRVIYIGNSDGLNIVTGTPCRHRLREGEAAKAVSCQANSDLDR